MVTVQINVTHKTIHRRIKCSGEALDTPSLDLVGPVEIDDVYVSAGKKGRERGWSIALALSMLGRGSRGF